MIYGKNGDLGYNVSYEPDVKSVDKLIHSETGEDTDYRFTLVDKETGKKIRIYTCETLQYKVPARIVPVYMRKLLAGVVETVVFSTRRNFTYWGGGRYVNQEKRNSMELSHFIDINSIIEVSEMLDIGRDPCEEARLGVYIQHMAGVHWYNELATVKFVEQPVKKTLDDVTIIYRIDGKTGIHIEEKLDSGKVSLFKSHDMPDRTESGYEIVDLSSEGCIYMDRPVCTLYVDEEPEDMNRTGYIIKGVSRYDS